MVVLYARVIAGTARFRQQILRRNLNFERNGGSPNVMRYPELTPVINQNVRGTIESFMSHVRPFNLAMELERAARRISPKTTTEQEKIQIFKNFSNILRIKKKPMAKNGFLLKKCLVQHHSSVVQVPAIYWTP
jgi:hypothetical protein